MRELILCFGVIVLFAVGMDIADSLEKIHLTILHQNALIETRVPPCR